MYPTYGSVEAEALTEQIQDLDINGDEPAENGGDAIEVDSHFFCSNGMLWEGSLVCQIKLHKVDREFGPRNCSELFILLQQ